MLIAVTRDVSPRFNECEITHIDRSPIDINIAQAQHHGYVQALKELGCAVLELPSEADLPDSVFVEDAAVILSEVALLTRPGADSRKPETESIARALAPYRELVRIEAPTTVDGGDVLVIGKKIFVGMSTRSNRNAIEQMNQLLGKYDYRTQGVELRDCLHLKSAVTRVDDETLLINRKWVDVEIFEGYKLIDIDPAEPHAANCLPLNGSLIFPTAFPNTTSRLEACGYKIKPVTVDELAKAEGAVTCCSLIVL
ncbi:MAG: N(G),N(G)-dimethylarginine dimethylaminohydrolase [Anaerolineales bacterium]|nr:N(G),N(G)-dimethylarginine dimethylaminohydrolase [Anaerolineales bacterium]